jgi:hypothetical protein
MRSLSNWDLGSFVEVVDLAVLFSRSEDFLERSVVFLAEIEDLEVELSFLSWDLIVGFSLELESEVGLMSLVLFFKEDSDGSLMILV